MDCTAGILSYCTAASSLALTMDLSTFLCIRKSLYPPLRIDVILQQFLRDFHPCLERWDSRRSRSQITSSPQNQLVPCPQNNSQKRAKTLSNPWGHLAQKFYSDPQQVILHLLFSYSSLIALFWLGGGSQFCFSLVLLKKIIIWK